MIPHIRTLDPQSPHVGKWAIIVGVEVIEPGPDRVAFPCYLVMWPNAKIDLWPVCGQHYEFMGVLVEPEGHAVWGDV